MPPRQVPAGVTIDSPVVQRRPRVQLGALLAAGVGLLVACGDLSFNRRNVIQFVATVVALAAGFIPPVNRLAGRFFDRIRHPSARARGATAVVVTILTAGYFVHTADLQNRVMLPQYHDEQMYAIQARLVAQGRLWLPAHPLADFFETFHVMTRPVYAPIYFPGTAILFAPAVWLGLAMPMMSVMIAGAIVGWCYRIFAELFDGVAGALAALMALALAQLHFVSIMIMSHEVVLFLGLTLIWAWLHWRRERWWGWAAVMGPLAGWAAVTRPLDAICFALPIAIATLIDLRGQSLRRWVVAAIAAVAGAIPFLATQAVLDYGTTGHVLQTPAGAYAARYWPAAGLGFKHVDPSFRPPTKLVEFQEYYDRLLVPGIEAHARDGFGRSLAFKVLPSALNWGMASVLLVLLVPAGLVGLRNGRWVVAAALPLFAIGYACYPFVLQHYALAVAPALTALALAGICLVRRTSAVAATAVTLAVAAACLTSLHEINPAVHDPNLDAPFLLDIYIKLSAIREPAVVLFRYQAGGDYNEEPVYNSDVAWPDDAPIIRAHDLGPRNAELFTYYAKVSPDRVVYRYDFHTQSLDQLGSARDLAAAATATPSR